MGRVDGIYDDEGIIVELDGMRDHTDWSKDMWRDNEHALQLGAVTLRYGWWALELTPCAWPPNSPPHCPRTDGRAP